MEATELRAKIKKKFGNLASFYRSAGIADHAAAFYRIYTMKSDRYRIEYANLCETLSAPERINKQEREAVSAYLKREGITFARFILDNAIRGSVHSNRHRIFTAKSHTQQSLRMLEIIGYENKEEQ